MIVETSNDLFRTKQKTLLVPCNAAGAMGSGLALAFKKRFGHELFRTYRSYFPLVVQRRDMPTDDKRATTLVCVKLPTAQQVLLFCTKRHWTEASDPALLESNLLKLAAGWDVMGIESISMPPIGCGLGGLDYRRVVRPLIFKHLSEERFDVEIVGLHETEL